MDKNVLGETFTWFITAIPEPSEVKLQVQMGVHFEEVGEHLDALTGTDAETQGLIDDARMALAKLAGRLKHKETKRVEVLPEDRLALLDALCDQIVTATGTAYLADLKIIGGLNEVNRSNYAKFVDGKPIFHSTGKIAKPEGWMPPNLEPFL